MGSSVRINGYEVVEVAWIGEELTERRTTALAAVEAAGYNVRQHRPEVVHVTRTPGQYTATRIVRGQERVVYGSGLEELARDVASKENKGSSSV